MKFSPAALSSSLFLAASAAAIVSAEQAVNPAVLDAAVACNQEYGPLTFVLLEDEAVNAAIEDDIRADLAKIGFEVEKRPLSKADLNTARQSGNFHFSITETWGTPYDPMSYASGWIDGKGGAGVYPSMINFSPGSSRDELLGMVETVLQQEDPRVLTAQWEAIHKYYHSQAILMPLYGKRIPTLLNNRLSGYTAGFQQYDYPVHKLVPASTTSTTVTIAPGARTGLFETIGTMNAHVYGPNELFSNNWVYEGLVAYGANGRIIPALAQSWVVTSNNIGGDTYTFQLPTGVKFHDGADWNCTVAKMNFDHIFAGSLKESKHGWYGVGKYTDNWSCNSETEFVVNTNFKHGPYLQELSLIRPVRMMSPNAFPELGANPLDANTCHVDWGMVDKTEALEAVNCVGIESIAGTGPFVYDSSVEADGQVERAIFTAHEDYWGGAPAIKRLEIVRYATASDVKAALLSGELDVVWGSGVLSDTDIVEIQNDPALSGQIEVFHSDAVQNVILLLNSGMPPFDDINVRKTVIHAIDKAAIVRNELQGLQSVVDTIFPLTAPYCDVDLTPRWDYDFEKAVLLSCDGNITSLTVGSAESGEKDNTLALGLGIGLGALVVVVGVVAVAMHNKNKGLEQELSLARKESAVPA
ncbi:MAG: hypothetical protein SGARI_001251 [Bacillariaceae sp.]